jgi:hypothetical protein
MSEAQDRHSLFVKLSINITDSQHRLTDALAHGTIDPHTFQEAMTLMYSFMQFVHEELRR